MSLKLLNMGVLGVGDWFVSGSMCVCQCGDRVSGELG